MGLVINTNTAATTAAFNLNQSTNMLNQSLARLSSGSQIVNASDDPAGLAESIQLNAQIGETNAANANVSNAQSMLQTSDGYLQQVGSALDQMATLATQAQDETKSSSQLQGYQSEFNALAGYIISTSNATFNGVSLFAGATMSVTTDANGGAFNFGTASLGAGAYSALTGASADGSAAQSIANASSAATTQSYVTSAITQLASDRATVGAAEERLNFVGNNLGVLSNNLSAANSQITDVNVATESTNYAKYQILVQSGTAMLAQANTAPQTVLKLLS